jgi:ubiquinone/menaquinone biosynthesis C-methylase UbiE
MKDLLKTLKPACMIDVACGTGEWMRHFQQAGVEVFGCDACEEMLRQAIRSRCLRGRVALGDAHFLPFVSSRADLVVCSISLGYFQRLDLVFEEFARALRPGGWLAISDLHPDTLKTGWTRSFRSASRVFEIEYYAHTITKIELAASHAGFGCKVLKHAHVSVEELPIFEKAGRAEQFGTVASVPALFLGLWEKPC